MKLFATIIPFYLFLLVLGQTAEIVIGDLEEDITDAQAFQTAVNNFSGTLVQALVRSSSDVNSLCRDHVDLSRPSILMLAPRVPRLAPQLLIQQYVLNFF